MRVVLYNPPSPEQRGTPLGPHALAEHLGLGCLAAHLRARGDTVLILDADALKIPDADALGRIFDFGPEAMGVTLTGLSLWRVPGFLRRVRERLPGLEVTVGGHHATVATPEVAATGIGRVIVGEPDRKGPEDPGPLPERDTLEAMVRHSVTPHTALLISSRGCLFDCPFCPVPAYSRRCGRSRVEWPLPAVLNQGRDLASVGVRRVHLADDDALGCGAPGGPERCQELVARLVHTGLRVAFKACHPGTNELRALEGLARHLARRRWTHMVQVFLGLEGMAWGLGAPAKALPPQALAATLGRLSSLGIDVEPSVLLLSPWTTRRSALRALRFLLRHGICSSDAVLERAVPLPGTCVPTEAPAPELLEALAALHPALTELAHLERQAAWAEALTETLGTRPRDAAMLRRIARRTRVCAGMRAGQLAVAALSGRQPENLWRPTAALAAGLRGATYRFLSRADRALHQRE
ncbi:MAG: cobalamin-dependent protein [Acetobacteraceae bacterium]|nr:cobalamin-dependent protein [Acetobacteraceae bacterium]